MRFAFLLCVALAAHPSLAAESISGAFGFPFGVPLRNSESITPTDTPTALSLPAPLVRDEPDVRNEVNVAWRKVKPAVIPKVLADGDLKIEVFTLLDRQGAPVRIMAKIASERCPTLHVQVGAILSEKYGEAEHLEHSHRCYHDGRNYAQMACAGGQLVLDYVDSFAYREWQSWQRGRVDDYDRKERLALAEQLVVSNAGNIDGAFGVLFAEAIRIPGAVADISTAVTPPTPLQIWPSAEYELMVDPTGKPIRAAATSRWISVAAAQAEKDRLAAALIEKFGHATKDTPRHTVISRAGRHAVLQLRDDASLSLIFIDNAALTQAHTRHNQREALLAEQLQRKDRSEKAGL